MQPNLQEFLANAQARILPGATRDQLVRSLRPELVPTISFDTQACRGEWASVDLSMAVTATPCFLMPENPIDEVTRYLFIGVRDVGGVAANRVWLVQSQYPGMPDEMEERYQGQTGSMTNLLNSQLSGGAQARRGLPYRVLPRGTLSIESSGTYPGGTTIRCQILREVCGGLASAERLVNILVGQTK